MATKVKVNMNSTGTILLKRKLNSGGEGQRFLTSEVKRFSDPYTPMDSGVLKSNVTMDVNSITYKSPYSKYQYYGKVMAGNPRVATDKDLKYQGAPMRGKLWEKRMLADRGKELTESVAKFIGGKAK